VAKTKYDYLFKKLVYNVIPGTEDNPEYITRKSGADLEGMNLNFLWSYQNRVGNWAAGGKYGHVHPYGEIFLFTGLDYAHPNSLGAELEISLGAKAEDHAITSPSIVVIPGGVEHLPITTKNVDKPFGFLVITLSPENKATELNKRDKAFGLANECGDMIHRMEMRDLKRKEGGNADYFAWWNGKKHEGFLLNFTWAFHTGVGYWHDNDPHVHPNDEALVFVGTDPKRPDYLGAEIEFRMGEEQEVHIFNEPTVVVAPKGLVHCPLITRKVEQPYAFTAICLAHEHETKWLGGNPNAKFK
jgi:hypothetical protein